MVIRIGTKRCEELKGKRIIQGEVFLVAEIPRSAYRSEYDINFLAVDTWKVGGVQIGHREDGEPFDMDKMANDYHLDPAFVNTPDSATLNPFLFDIADDLVEYQLVQSLSEGSSNGFEKLKIVAAPVNPTYAARGDEPTILQGSRRSGNIDVIIYFKNKISGEDLGLPGSLQAELGHSETCADVEKLVMDGDDKFEGGLRRKLTTTKPGFEVQIWVLPQIMHSSKMYSWIELCDWKTCYWLSKDVVDWYGRELYMEVHVLPGGDEGGVEYLEEEKIEASEAGRRLFEAVDAAWQAAEDTRDAAKRELSDLETEGDENAGLDDMALQKDKKRKGKGRKAKKY